MAERGTVETGLRLSLIHILATEGTKAPENCKFTVAVAEIEIMEVIEIIPCTQEAIESIEGVREWKR